jgi:GntR family transcriptional regulator
VFDERERVELLDSRRRRRFSVLEPLGVVDRKIPQYLKIYRDLRRRIDEGELAPGDRLPPQRDLSRQFNVTLMTLRQAIQLLESDGLVSTRQGRGTYISPKLVSYDVRALRSLAQEMFAQGRPLTTRVLSRRTVEARPHAAELLEVEPGERLLELERLRLIDGKPVVYQRSHLPLWLAADLAALDLEDGSLYDYLDQTLGVEVVRAHETLRPIVLAAREAKLLDAAAGSPAIVSERLTYTTDDRPIVYDEATMPGDRIVVTAERRRSDLTVVYTLDPRTRERAT